MGVPFSSATSIKRIILVGGRRNGEATVAFNDEPGPTGAETGAGGAAELFLEAIVATERFVDGASQVAARLAAAVGGHHFPKQVVVVVATTVVAYTGAGAAGLLEDVLDALTLQVGTFQGGVQFLGIPGVVLTVVNAHRAGVDVWF